MKTTICALCLLGATSLQARDYSTFDFPSQIEGSKTLLTGIRRVDSNHDKVYISGFYKCPEEACVVPFVYKGHLDGDGVWSILNFPSSDGVTVVATNLYGPNNGKDGDIRVVGNYTTEETGEATLGCLYEGPLDGTGKWTTLIPTSTSPVLNTIAHSTHGNFVVGNYDTQIDEGKAFIYDLKHEVYYEIVKENALSITAYGIWHNGGHFYTICGGFSDVDAIDNFESGYLVDWDSKHKRLSNWRTFNYNNDPEHAHITHFDGITTDKKGGYYLTGDWINLVEGQNGFFCHVKKDATVGIWSNITYPGAEVTSGNSVYKKVVIGVYAEEADDSVHGYISRP